MKYRSTMTARITRLHSLAGVEAFNIGHRGARAFAPENTIEAFEKALRLGCHMVELDVHLTLDDVLVVHHDDELGRCTDVAARYPGRQSYYVSDFTAQQISALDAGSWFTHQLLLEPTQRASFLRALSAAEMSAMISEGEVRLFASGSVRVPTLAEVFERLEPSALLVNVEIKSLPRMYSGIAAQVIDCIKRHGMQHRTLVSSFDHEQLAAVRAASSQLATAVLTSDRMAQPARYLELLDADAYHPSCHGEHDSLGFNSVQQTLQCDGIAQVLAAGKDVNTWTCNDPVQMQQLLDAGVTGIFTDYPNRLAEVISRKAALHPS